MPAGVSASSARSLSPTVKGLIYQAGLATVIFGVYHISAAKPAEADRQAAKQGLDSVGGHTTHYNA
jgi:hypothetical protein